MEGQLETKRPSLPCVFARSLRTNEREFYTTIFRPTSIERANEPVSPLAYAAVALHVVVVAVVHVLLPDGQAWKAIEEFGIIRLALLLPQLSLSHSPSSSAASTTLSFSTGPLSGYPYSRE